MSDASSPHAPAARGNHAFALGAYIALLLGLGALYYVLRLDLLPMPARFLPPLRRVVAGAMAILLILALARLVRARAIDAIDNPVTRYNLRRIVGLAVMLLIALIVVSVLFANWYAAVASLGLTRRECEVLDLLASGKTNEELARSLGVSPNTIKTHLASLFAKLEVDRRVKAIEKARFLSLIE